VEVYYFTFTGTSKKIAEFIGKIFNIKPKEIKSYKLPYLLWLFLSFIPYLSLKAIFEPPTNDTVILCFPKWTFNCPPVTCFLKKIKCKKLVLIISYKGWGEKSYANLYKKLISKDVKKVTVILIKERVWKEIEKIIYKSD